MPPHPRHPHGEHPHTETARPRGTSRLSVSSHRFLVNALQATPAGGRIAVSTRAEGDQALLLVHDTGAGIPPEELPRLFERHSRRRESSHPRGSGLGLAIVAALAAAHGGRVEVESAPGTGTCFTVCLPRLPGSIRST